MSLACMLACSHKSKVAYRDWGLTGHLTSGGAVSYLLAIAGWGSKGEGERTCVDEAQEVDEGALL